MRDSSVTLPSSTWARGLGKKRAYRVAGTAKGGGGRLQLGENDGAKGLVSTGTGYNTSQLIKCSCSS